MQSHNPSPRHEKTMKSSVCAALLASVAGVAASRPQVVPSPVQPRVPVPNPPVRTKQCVVQTNGDGSDDSEHILSAFEDCNNGGHVVFSENATYTIGTAMDWTFLKSIDIGELPIETAIPHGRAEHKSSASCAGMMCSPAYLSRRVPAVIVPRHCRKAICLQQPCINGDGPLTREQQTSGVISSLPTIPTTGRPTLSSSDSKTSLPSSNWAETMSLSMEVCTYHCSTLPSPFLSSTLAPSGIPGDTNVAFGRRHDSVTDWLKNRLRGCGTAGATVKPHNSCQRCISTRQRQSAAHDQQLVLSVRDVSRKTNSFLSASRRLGDTLIYLSISYFPIPLHCDSLPQASHSGFQAMMTVIQHYLYACVETDSSHRRYSRWQRSDLVRSLRCRQVHTAPCSVSHMPNRHRCIPKFARR